MNKSIKTYSLVLASLLFMLLLSSCGDDTPETQTIPRNYFEGVIDGTPLANTSMQAYKDVNDVYTIIGSSGDGKTLIIFVNGKTEDEYPATQGTVLEVSELLDLTITADSAFLDSIQATINMGSNNLPAGECYALLISNGDFFYSNRGSVTITGYDGSINRIYGLIDIEVKNFEAGPRYIQGFFEDVYYTDCPQIGICIL